jgi:hypothetical protein
MSVVTRAGAAGVLWLKGFDGGVSASLSLCLGSVWPAADVKRCCCSCLPRSRRRTCLAAPTLLFKRLCIEQHKMEVRGIDRLVSSCLQPAGRDPGLSPFSSRNQLHPSLFAEQVPAREEPFSAGAELRGTGKYSMLPYAPHAAAIGVAASCSTVTAAAQAAAIHWLSYTGTATHCLVCVSVEHNVLPKDDLHGPCQQQRRVPSFLTRICQCTQTPLCHKRSVLATLKQRNS